MSLPALPAVRSPSAMQLLSDHAAFPLMFVPFATSIVLVMGTPDAEPAQPGRWWAAI